MAGPLHSFLAQVDPAEMAQGPPVLILPMAGDASGIEIGGAAAVSEEGDALPPLAAQGVMHVAEHNQGHGAPGTDALQSQGEIMVSPVAGLPLPVAAAGVTGLAPQARGPAMGQEHEGEGRIGGQGGSLDTSGRIVQIHRAEHGRGGLGKMVPPPGGGWASTHHRQTGGCEGAQGPAAVEIPEQVELVTQTAATGIPAGVMVAQHTGQGKAKLPEQTGDARLAVAQVTHHQQGIRADGLQHGMVAVIPLVVEVTGDGDLQHAQRLPLLRLSPSCPTRGPG